MRVTSGGALGGGGALGRDRRFSSDCRPRLEARPHRRPPWHAGPLWILARTRRQSRRLRANRLRRQRPGTARRWPRRRTHVGGTRRTCRTRTALERAAARPGRPAPRSRRLGYRRRADRGTRGHSRLIGLRRDRPGRDARRRLRLQRRRRRRRALLLDSKSDGRRYDARRASSRGGSAGAVRPALRLPARRPTGGLAPRRASPPRRAARRSALPSALRAGISTAGAGSSSTGTGLAALTRRGGGRSGAAGFGRLRCLLRRARLLDAALLNRRFGEHVARRQRDVALPRKPFDELPSHDLFDRARRALHFDPVIALEQRRHFLARRAQKFRDSVNPDSAH